MGLSGSPQGLQLQFRGFHLLFQVFIHLLKLSNAGGALGGVTGQVCFQLLQLGQVLGGRGTLAVQSGQFGVLLRDLGIQAGHPLLQGGLPLSLGLALRAQGGGGAFQLLDAGLGLCRGSGVLLHAAADLFPLGLQGLMTQIDICQQGGGAVRALGIHQHRVLCLTQLGGGGVQFIVGGGQLALHVGQLGGGGLQILHQAVLLAVQSFQLVGTGQDARASGHGTAGHGAAGIEHLTVQRDDAEPVTKLAGDGHGPVHVLGNDDTAQQVGENVGVALVKGNERVAHADETVFLFHGLVAEIGRFDGIHGQESGAAAVAALQPLNCVLTVLIPLHHDILHGAAQSDLNGDGVLVGYVEQSGHRTVDALDAAPLRLIHHQLDRLGVAFVHLLHLGQQADAGVQIVLLHLQVAVLFLSLIHLALAGLTAHLITGDDVAGGVTVVGDTLQLLLHLRSALLCFGNAILLGQDLLPQLFLPVQQLLGRGSQCGQQFLGLAGRGAFQTFPFLQGFQFTAQSAGGAEGLVHLLCQLLQLLMAQGSFGLDLRQTGLAVSDLLGNGAGTPRLLLQLFPDALGVLAVIFHIIAQQVDPAFAAVDAALQFGLLRAHTLRLQILFHHLLAVALHGGVQRIHVPADLITLADSVVQIGLELDAVGAQLLQLLQPDGDLQPLQLVTVHQELFGLLRLDTQRLHLQLQLVDLIVDTDQILVGTGQLALGLLLAVAETGDTGGLFEDLTAVGTLDGQDLVNAALTDDGVALTAQTGVHKQLVDVTQAAGTAVDVILAFTGAVIPTGHGNLGLLHGEDVLGIVDDQRDLGKAQALSLGGTVKNDVLHLGAAEGTGGLLTHDPANGVCYIGLTRTVGADDGCDVRAEGQHRLVREGFESLNFKRFQIQCAHLIICDFRRILKDILFYHF